MLAFKDMGKQFKIVQTGQLILDGRVLKQLKKKGVPLIKVEVEQAIYYSSTEFVAFYEKHVKGKADAPEYTLLVKTDGTVPSPQECQDLITFVLLSPWQSKTNRLGYTYYEIPLPTGFLVVKIKNKTRSNMLNGVFRMDKPTSINLNKIPAAERAILESRNKELHPTIIYVEHIIVAQK